MDLITIDDGARCFKEYGTKIEVEQSKIAAARNTLDAQIRR